MSQSPIFTLLNPVFFNETLGPHHSYYNLIIYKHSVLLNMSHRNKQSQSPRELKCLLENIFLHSVCLCPKVPFLLCILGCPRYHHSYYVITQSFINVNSYLICHTKIESPRVPENKNILSTYISILFVSVP